MSNSQLNTTPTLLEKIIEISRFDLFCEFLPKPIENKDYVYVFIFIFFDITVINTYSHLTGGTHGMVRNPFIISFYIGLGLATIGTKYMNKAHIDAIELLIDREIVNYSDVSDYSVSIRSRFLIYVTAIAIFIMVQIFSVGLTTIVQEQGLPGVIFTLVLLPGCYLPIAIDLVSEYITLHIFIPRCLSKQDPSLFFFDPQNMGGFRPIGEILKNSYYIYTGALLLYLIWVYGIFVTPVKGDLATAPGLKDMVFFSILWVFGVMLLTYSMYKIHRVMKTERTSQLRTVEKQLQGLINNPHDITKSEVTDQKKFDSVEYRLQQIRATSEYPTTFNMWAQIGISVLLPQVFQLTLQATI